MEENDKNDVENKKEKCSNCGKDLEYI